MLVSKLSELMTLCMDLSPILLHDMASSLYQFKVKQFCLEQSLPKDQFGYLGSFLCRVFHLEVSSAASVKPAEAAGKATGKE